MPEQVVIDAVLSWANAPDFSKAHQAVKTAKANLSESQFSVVISEIAEINVESFVQLCMPREEDSEEPVVEFEGVSFTEKQAKRLSAWLSDQEGLGEALGLSLESWSSLLTTKMKKLVASLKDTESFDDAGIDAAQKLLGTSGPGTASFEPRKSAGQGFASLLAAKSFKKPKK